MIHIKRSRVPVPRPLNRKGQNDLTETERAIKWYAVDRNQGTFNFQVYRDPEVKTALRRLFHGKCAYCEASYVEDSPGDVEHFRPKSAIKINGRIEKPGYYWLAADWDNLLPSCSECNRERTQEFPDSSVKVAGKSNWFPVKGKHVRSHTKNVIKEEKRLLLHPCRDFPNRHLEFTFRGGIRYIPGSEKGLHSIEVFALNRNGLVDGRNDRTHEILGQARSVIDWLDELKEEGDSSNRRRKLARSIREFHKFGLERKEFAGMARQLIARIENTFRRYASEKLSTDLQNYVEQLISQAEWRK